MFFMPSGHRTGLNDGKITTTTSVPILTMSDGSNISRKKWLHMGGRSVEIFRSSYMDEASAIEDGIQKELHPLSQGQATFVEARGNG